MKRGCWMGLATLVLLSGCTTSYLTVVDPLPRGAKVAMLVLDGDGMGNPFLAGRGYLYGALTERGLVPVITPPEVAGFFRDFFGPEGVEFSAAFSPSGGAASMTFDRLMEWVPDDSFDYLLLVNVQSLALDEVIDAVLIRTSDHQIVASKYYRYRSTAVICLTALPGVSFLYCGFLFLNDQAAGELELLDGLLGDFMGTATR